ncbi:MAG: superinfection immunity protein [Dehalococcoidales bacterium]|jgi:hypothetical protein|nr:superinfection immunity protein [Dehalococcoidales bacterium]
MFWFLIILFIIYLIPTYIAQIRESNHSTGITLLNIFFGWTIFLWIVCFIWAFISTTKNNKNQELKKRFSGTKLILLTILTTIILFISLFYLEDNFQHIHFRSGWITDRLIYYNWLILCLYGHLFLTNKPTNKKIKHRTVTYFWLREYIGFNIITLNNKKIALILSTIFLVYFFMSNVLLYNIYD